MVAGDLCLDDGSLLRDLVVRAGEADRNGFGLTMEDCSDLLDRLGQALQLSTSPLPW